MNHEELEEHSTRRVLMTADTVGGVWTYATELIRALEPHRVEVLLATMGRAVSSAQRREIGGLSNVEIAERCCKLEWMEDCWEDVQAAGEWLLELESRFQPDLIHLNGYAHAALPWRAPKLVAGHSCVLSWWEGVKGERAPAHWDRYQREVQRGLQAADLVVAPTGAMLNSLLEHYGLLSETRVIPNGRSLTSFRPGAKEKMILSAGRLWDEAKNVRAVCACSSTWPWPVCVAGETNTPDGKESDPSGFQTVCCLGHLCEVELADWMARASIYALPARYEPFGLSILEAAMSECALVLGDIPSLRENWTGAAIFVDPSDTANLADAIRELIEKPRVRAELGHLARERSLQFDIDVTALRYLDAYAAVRARAAEVQEDCVTV